MQTYAVLVEDTAGEESASFAVEASTALIACTRTAMRLFGPEAETRPVYGCSVCGAELREADAPDSSGFRFCPDCSPEDLESREEQEPIGLAVATAHITALELAPLPGDAPVGRLRVVVPGPAFGPERGDAFADDDDARAAIERALARSTPLGDALGDLTVRDAAGAYFRYGLRVAATPIDAEDLVARGLIDEEAELDATASDDD